jgi:hypothetical protein
MSGYDRKTWECRASELQPELLQAIRDYFRLHQLGDVEAETRSCCETLSTRRSSGKLLSLLEGGGDTSFHLVTLLTSEWLVWARLGDKTATVVTGARLKTIQTKMMVEKRTQNINLDVQGFMNGTKEYARGTLALGPEPAAQRFCEEVVRTVLTENPPAKKEGRRWFGV